MAVAGMGWRPEVADEEDTLDELLEETAQGAEVVRAQDYIVVSLDLSEELSDAILMYEQHVAEEWTQAAANALHRKYAIIHRAGDLQRAARILVSQASDYLTSDEAADLLQTTVGQVNGLCLDGRLRAIKQRKGRSNKWSVERASVDDYAADGDSERSLAYRPWKNVRVTLYSGHPKP